MNEPDNPMVSPCYRDCPTVEVTDPYEVKYQQCQRCGERTADADLDGDGVCDICREEMREPGPYPWEDNYKKPPF